MANRRSAPIISTIKHGPTPTPKAGLVEGARIYTTGDMANPAGLGTITGVTLSQWGVEIAIAFDDGRKTSVDQRSFSEEFKGNGSTRFVLKDAYDKFQAARMAEFHARFPRAKEEQPAVSPIPKAMNWRAGVRS